MSARDISHELFIGMLVAWAHKPRGGYGYIMPVDAKIVALSPDGRKAIIEVETKSGRKVQRNVSHTSIYRRGERMDP